VETAAAPATASFASAPVAGAAIPVPPVPPALGAGGEVLTNAAGETLYAPINGMTAAQTAQAATDAAAINAAGGIVPEQTGLAGIAQSLGLTPAAGTLGNALPAGAGDGSLASLIPSAGGLAKVAAPAVAAAGLGKLMAAGGSVPGLDQIKALAGLSATQGQTLQNYLATGTLPPAIQQSVDAATRDAVTQIKARYAGMGMAPGSSQETADIARTQQNAVIQGAQLADQLLQQGISESQLAGTLYNELVNYNSQLNTQTGAAIGNLASALAGGGVTLKVGA
jgi:hypothetical protein